MLNKIWFMAVILGAVGFVAGLALAGVNSMTKPVIEQAILKEKIEPTLKKHFGPINVDNDFIKDRKQIDLGKDDRGRIQRLTIFKGKKGATVVGAALETKAAGFGGDVKVLTVFDVNTKKILGVKTLEQSETVGLGARVADDSEPFIQQFTGMDYPGGVAVQSNGGKVDVISGATVSSVAFTQAVNSAVSLLKEHNAEVMAE